MEQTETTNAWIRSSFARWDLQASRKPHAQAILSKAARSSSRIHRCRKGIPGAQLAFYVVFAALLGVFFAIFPARRAAKLNVLDAISYE